MWLVLPFCFQSLVFLSRVSDAYKSLIKYLVDEVVVFFFLRFQDAFKGFDAYALWNVSNLYLSHSRENVL